MLMYPLSLFGSTNYLIGLIRSDSLLMLCTVALGVTFARLACPPVFGYAESIYFSTLVDFLAVDGPEGLDDFLLFVDPGTEPIHSRL